MSEKPVAERLQVKEERRLAVVGATPDQDAVLGVHDKRAKPADADVMLVFVRDHGALRAELEVVLPILASASILWIAYPKLSSKLAGDLSRDTIRAVAQQYGLHTVSQIAIDGDWSALRLKRVT